jgi:hypothetical protein
MEKTVEVVAGVPRDPSASFVVVKVAATEGNKIG